ncbi:hypothetical protein UFOVP611_39 [uncultured Caudovirales phage]|uniref:Uncharacterized protein n=1 Tax=uncultured Caudovirales phage TaxID=2100421 RepID=A0A6J5N2H0_9CAUD|nr:hypothetical protein UFOVP611_39 [uncultured Caudovirales phage]
MKQEIKYKLKKLEITVNYRDPLDLKQALLKVIEQIDNGNNIVEMKVFNAYVGAYLEFVEKEFYTEKQINGIWYQCIKSKI